jgi:hypothetical protein
LSEDGERKRDASGRFVAEHDPEFWLSVRFDYEHSPLTIERMSDKHMVAESTIQERARDELWERRRPRRIDPNDLVMRMLDLLDRQIENMEEQVKKGTTEVAMLAKLVTTLDKVLLLKERSAAEEPAISTKEADELRAKIAERIRELNGA